MKIALCQLDPIMGDIEGNVALVKKTVATAQPGTIDLFVFSELFVQGYPPRDLLECRWFVDHGMAAVQELAAFSKTLEGAGILVGCVLPTHRKLGKGLFNAALLLADGVIRFQQNKSLLPTYDVFDETRYFDPAPSISLCEFKGEKLGITICEDAWNNAEMWEHPLYDRDPVAELARAGATILINLSGSPFYSGKETLRHEIIRKHAVMHRLPFVFVNQVGGNDELIFDGDSRYMDGRGNLVATLPLFQAGTTVVDTGKSGSFITEPVVDAIANIHDALVLGVRDYLKKCGFKSVQIGLSGGIDSAVTAAIAAAAVGRENVYGVTMPSRYSSGGSVEDSRQLAQRLGIGFDIIPIEPVFNSLTASLETAFAGMAPDLAEENLQARIRGTILMALSNKHGRLVLTTGNKSEMAVGYCTLYGDMNGGLAVIADLPKTRVYDLARYINRNDELIPVNSIIKPPSAELRPDQKDQDTLPPYEILDAILARLVEKGMSRHEITRDGFDAAVVDWVARAVRLNEYKRRQAAPGLKVTPKAFGSGRRFPLAARYDFS